MKGAIFACVLVVTAVAAMPRAQTGYVDAEACQSCHPAIADSYRRVSMSRTFQTIRNSQPIEDWTRNNRLFHAPSKQYFEMTRRGDRFFERRYQVGPDGKPIHDFEVEIDYAIGSGNHERDYLHRSEAGEITQLPVVWYAETRSWGMAPGYDRPDHEGFTRRLNYRCVFCHSAYPTLPTGADRSESQLSLFPASMSSVNCERCHGPGERHARDGSPASIVNPAKLSRKLQMDVCMQCHLETTSAPLPNSVLKLGRSAFSFRPGEPLESYAAYFDYPRNSGHDDDFNIVHQAYRLRKSQCFAASNMTCTTCHDPHRPPDQPKTFYKAQCMTCHQESSCKLATLSRSANGDDCIACHMPKRRTDDIVHVVMTDHFIQRRAPQDLLRPKTDRHNEPYRGALSVYLPETESDLYLGMALARGTDPQKGIQLLERAVSRKDLQHAEVYFQLAAAYTSAAQNDRAIARYVRGLELDPDHAEARFNMAIVLMGVRKYNEAAAALKQVIGLKPQFADAHVALGAVMSALNQLDSARTHYADALRVDPLNTVALDNLGLLELRSGHRDRASEYFDRALRINPDDVTAKQSLKQ